MVKNTWFALLMRETNINVSFESAWTTINLHTQYQSKYIHFNSIIASLICCRRIGCEVAAVRRSFIIPNISFQESLGDFLSIFHLGYFDFVHPRSSWITSINFINNGEIIWKRPKRWCMRFLEYQNVKIVWKVAGALHCLMSWLILECLINNYSIQITNQQ